MFSRVQNPLLAQSVFSVEQAWRTCRLGGKTADRQHSNFTQKRGFSQVLEMLLWINKSLQIN
jgi:hypothetical protein